MEERGRTIGRPWRAISWRAVSPRTETHQSWIRDPMCRTPTQASCKPLPKRVVEDFPWDFPQSLKKGRTRPSPSPPKMRLQVAGKGPRVGLTAHAHTRSPCFRPRGVVRCVLTMMTTDLLCNTHTHTWWSSAGVKPFTASKVPPGRLVFLGGRSHPVCWDHRDAE